MQNDLFWRYSRQMLFTPIGRQGQERLLQKRVAIVGAGALGTVLANHLVRAGVGFVRLIDRDFVEPSNLQRQMLYDEEDARQQLPKAIAAGEKLHRINSHVTIDPVVADVTPANAESLLADVELILDGTDNFPIRYLINDVSIKHGIPWVYGGAVRDRGMFAVIRPGETPCYRCLFPQPPAGHGETCDTVGVIGPIVHIVASYQAAEGLKLLLDDTAHVNPCLVQFELWANEHSQMDLSHGRNQTCPACVRRQFDYLEERIEGEIYTTICGRDSVQITPAGAQPVDLSRLAHRLQPLGTIMLNNYLLRFRQNDFTLVFFPDGRVLVQGTQDITVARSLYARYTGN